MREKAAAQGLAFDAVNSNTFQDQPGQELSYKFGSLSHTDTAVRDQAVAHNIDCIEIGRKLGSKALTVWIADGSNFAGQSNLTRALDRYLDAMREIYAALPADWRVFLEHKLYEPAFYSTVISDWGTSFAAAQELGPKANCLVDLGHHAPNVNIEQIVARLVRFGKLGGFHFNDSKYGDDDLDSRLGRSVPAVPGLQRTDRRRATQGGRLRAGLYDRPVAQRDRSDREPDAVGDRIAARLCAGSGRRSRGARSGAGANDALGAHLELKRAFTTDVSPLLAVARLRAGGAIAPIAAYRASGYRAQKATERPAVAGTSAGIV